MIPFKETATAAYENAKAHGFWQGWPDILEVQDILIHTEVSEAVEELRLDEAKHGGKLGDLLFDLPNGSRGNAKQAHEIHKSEPERKLFKLVGFMSEIADTCIRCLNIYGYLATLPEYLEDTQAFERGHLQNYVINHVEGLKDTKKPDPPPGPNGHRQVVISMLSFAHKQIMLFDLEKDVRHLGSILCVMYDIAHYIDGDLDAAIKLKMAYNKQREFRHGKIA